MLSAIKTLMMNLMQGAFSQKCSEFDAGLVNQYILNFHNCEYFAQN